MWPDNGLVHARAEMQSETLQAPLPNDYGRVIDDLRFALLLADAADDITRQPIGPAIADVATKADGSAVTPVDLHVEATLFAIIERERPEDGVLGEEIGSPKAGVRRWIVDGIDGTEAFIAQRPEWSTLIALEDHGALKLGVVSAPALSSRWWAASGDGAWSSRASDRRPGEGERLTVSRQDSLADSTVGVWPPAEALAGPRHDAAVRLAEIVKRNPLLPQARGRSAAGGPSRGSGYPNAGLLVAAGALDGVVLFGGGPWDHAALAIIVEEAGGRFTDLSGDRRIDGRGAVFSNGRIHGDLLACLNL
jgi:histidinol-phosphatase